MNETILNKDDKFSWIEVYKELFEVILSYENKQNDLVGIIQKITKSNEIDFGLDKIVKNNQEEFVEHSEIDPFTDVLKAFIEGDFTKTSSLQNPYSIYYPFPNPPFNPFIYGAGHRQPEVPDYDPGTTCLGGNCWLDTATGYEYRNHPRLWYHRLNIQTFNSFDHGEVPSDNYTSFMYINKYRDSYRNPTYPY